MKIRYFDNAATTQIKTDVIKKILPYLIKEFGNPSSLYTIGRKAKIAIEEARQQVANLIGCNKKEIYFTSGGTESDNTALNGIMSLKNNKGKNIITSQIEHPAILNTCKNLETIGNNITYLNVNQDGIINITDLQNSITKNTKLISIMFANNEIGTIQPIEEIGKIAHEQNIIFHTDAVQACGNTEIDVKKMNIDMLSLSGHKLGAPKGIGALYVNENIEFNSYIYGRTSRKK